jgi:ABC-type thiamin/hydroxymethylpyrimidine transport system permease subunit
MTTSSPLVTVLAPVITVAVQALKNAGLPVRFAPLAAVCAGIAAAVVFQLTNAPAAGVSSWTVTLLAGIGAGLAAAGLHASARASKNLIVRSPDHYLRQHPPKERP